MVASDTRKLVAARGASAIFMFTGVSIFSRLLSQSALGAFFLFEGILMVIRLVADAGIQDALEKRMSETDSPGTILTTALLLKLIPLLSTIVLLIISRPLIQQFIPSGLFVYLLIGVIIQELAYTTLGAISGERNPGKRAFLEASRYLVWILISLPLVMSGWATQGLAIGWLAGFMFVFAAGIFRVNTRITVPQKALIRPITTFAFYAGLGGVASVSFNWVDVLMLGHFRNPAVVSEYEVSWRVSRIGLLLPGAIRTAIVPQLSNRQAAGDWSAVSGLFSGMIFYVLLLPLPIAVGAILIGGPLLASVFTSAYADAWMILAILSVGQVAAALSAFFGPGIEAIDRPRLATQAILLGLFLNLILNVGLIPRYGAVGAAFATAASLICQCIALICLLISIPQISLPSLRQPFIQLIIAASLMGLVVGGLNFIFPVDQLLTVSFLILIGGTVYMMVIIFLDTPLRDVLIERKFKI